MKFENLNKSGILGALSETGREIALPQGIFYWSARAKKEALIDGTIGSAQGKKSLFIPGADDKVCTFYLPSVIRHLRELDPEKIVPYCPFAGAPRFRTAWRKWVVEKLSAHYSFDPALIGTPITVPGVTAALSYLSMLFVSRGGTIILHDKKWENYTLALEGVQGLKIKSARLFAGGGLDVDSFAAAVRETAAKENVAAILNFPNNPTGYMPGKEESIRLRDELVRIADKTGRKIVLIFDDAYDGFIFDPAATPISIFGQFIGAHPNIIPIKCDGASKEFLLYGGRIASITFGFHPEWGEPEQLQKEIDNKLGALIRGTISNNSHGMQQAIAAAIEEGEPCRRERARVMEILAARYRKLKKALESANLGAATADPFNAGFFCFMNLDIPAEKLADHLLVKHKLGLIPLSEPGVGVNGVRIAFCSIDETDIDETVSRIAAGLAELGQ
jgi:aspartate/methionine/tyrosine aminotransferase